MITIYSLWLAIACIVEVTILRWLFEHPKFVRWFYVPVVLSILGRTGRYMLVAYMAGMVAYTLMCLMIGDTPSGNDVKFNSKTKETKLWKFLSN